MVNAKAVTTAWENALNAPVWQGPPSWLHGDLQAGNLLMQAGQLSAVIDFGALRVGDPACDLIPAWNLFSTHTREIFRAASAPDAASWRRGRGWALSVALVALPYYYQTNPFLAELSRHAITETLSDYQQTVQRASSILLGVNADIRTTDAWRKGVELFNAGDYWETHEALEPPWLKATGPLKDFYGGIILLAAALHKARNMDSARGGRRNYAKALAHLAVVPDNYQGVNLRTLEAEVHAALQDPLKQPRIEVQLNLETP